VQTSKYHGVTVAAYPCRDGEPAQMMEFDFKGHALQKDIPKGTNFSQFLEVTTPQGDICLGKRPHEGWVVVIEDPLADPGTMCTYGRSPIYELDIVR
jgi:hypothetical protein